MWTNSRKVCRRLRTRWEGSSEGDASPQVRRPRLESLTATEEDGYDPLLHCVSELSKTLEKVNNVELMGRSLSKELDNVVIDKVIEPSAVDDSASDLKDDFFAGSPSKTPSVMDRLSIVDERCINSQHNVKDPMSSQDLSGDVGPSPPVLLCESTGANDKETESQFLSYGKTSDATVLSTEQKRVFNLVVHCGRSVLLTGGAGTGKSHLLRAIVNALPRRSTFVTATTGLAALNLGGVTVHSFSGCGQVDPLKDTPLTLYNRISSRAKANWRQCRVLVLDEISMMEAWFLDALEFIARKVRNNPSPFGGIQLVLSGDFLQLPPVVQNRSPDHPLFCFEASSWCRVNPWICVLSQSFRQKNGHFFSILNEMRCGVLSDSTITLLSSLSVNTRVSRLDDSIKNENGEGLRLVDDRGRTRGERHKGYTILRAKRDEVNRVNDERFEELTTPVFSYFVYHSVDLVKTVNRELEDVKLRVGCRVILTKNIDVSGGLVNGSTGTIVKFVDATKLKDFAGGTGPYDLRCISKENSESPHNHLPVVQFDTLSGGVVGEKGPSFLIEPQRWTVKSGDKDIGYSAQIPLRLAYAITIHKSQGMSLARVNVDFQSIFADGQAYVALSRCTNIENLVIENFNVGCITTNPRALAFYSALERRQRERDSLLSGDKMNTDSDEEDVLLTNPWGGRCVNSKGLTVNDEGVDASQLFETDEDSIIQNATTEIDVLRKNLTNTYNKWSSIRSRVLSSTRSAYSVQDSLLVMDETSLLALAILGGPTDIYDVIFLKNQNMMRVPQVVRDSLREGPVLSQNSAAFQSMTACGFMSTEAFAAARAIVSRAREEFVLDEQRDDEKRPLPETLSTWYDVHVLLDADTRNAQEGNGKRNRILEFSQYLHELHNSKVYVCTESLELAALALSLDMQVCSISYLSNHTSGRNA